MSPPDDRAANEPRSAREAVRPQLRRSIVVTGMHRSGTSAVAGALVAAGAWAGEVSALMPPTAYNERGHFERKSTADELDRILAELGGSWDAPPLDQLQPWTLEAVRPRLRAILHEVQVDCPAERVPLVKDPRLCLFAAEFVDLLSDDCAVVVVVRHPYEVARSLLERDGIPIAIGLALWESYNALLCQGLSHRPVYLLRYDQLVTEPQVIAELIESSFGFDREIGATSLAAAVGHLAAPLRHHRATPAEADTWLTVAQLRLWELFAESAAHDQPTVLPVCELSRSSRLLVDLARGWGAAEGRPAEVVDAGPSLADAQEVEASLRGDLAAALEAVEEHRVRRVESIAEQVDQAERIVGLRTGLAAAEIRRDEAIAALTGAAEETSQLRSLLAHSELRWASTVSELADARADATAAKEVARERLETQEVVGPLREELAESQRSLAQARERAGAAQERADLYSRRLAEVSGSEKRRIERGHVLSRQRTRAIQEWSAAEQVALAYREQIEDLGGQVHELLSLVDEARGVIEGVRSARADVSRVPLTGGLDDAELVDWVRTLTTTAARLEIDRASLSDEVQALRRELEAMDRHREELTEVLTSVYASESWRLGYAVTWPIRSLPGRRRRKSP